MAQEPDDSGTDHTANRQADLEAGFLDWLGSFGTDANIDDLALSAGRVVDAAKDPQA